MTDSPRVETLEKSLIERRDAQPTLFEPLRFTPSTTGRHFLVLEWMPENLEEYLKRVSFKDWDQYYAACGRPLLDALALAHARQVVHRDLKPTNILTDEVGLSSAVKREGNASDALAASPGVI